MGFLDRFRKPSSPASTPSNTTVQILTGDEPELKRLPPSVIDALHEITVTFPGPQQITDLPRDPPTMPLGGSISAAGTSHYEDAFVTITGGRTGDGFRADCTAELVPEPDNAYDANAVAVTIKSLKVGYLSRDDAVDYRPLVDEAIRSHGIATAAACIVGGWDRGNGDIGSFGIELRCSDRPDRADAPGEDEVRLRGSGTVSVSNEEHYQSALTAAIHGKNISAYSYPVVAELVWAERNPHVSKDSGGILEVRVDGRTVGFITPAMTQRYSRVANKARDEGKRLTCSANIKATNKKGTSIAEVTLSAAPHAIDERFVIDPYFTFNTDLVRNRRSKTLHRIDSTLPDGSLRTACGLTIKVADAVCFESTKPYVGYVEPNTHELVAEGTHEQCQRCV